MGAAAEVNPVSEERPEQLIERVQELQAALEEVDGPPPRGLTEELVSAVVQMYGLGLERILIAISEAGEAGRQVEQSLSEDPLVATLLLIHDLHPVPLEERVQAALESVRPYMESHGGNVELLGLENGIARIHLRGSCSDCSASSVTLELAIKQALEEAAPDLEGLEVQGIAPQTIGGTGLPMVTGAPPPTGIELPIVISGSSSAEAPAAPAWFEVVPGELAEGEVVPLAVAGSSLLVANVAGTLLAYRDACASCGDVIHDGVLRAGALACPRCGRSFFLPRAGRSMDDEGLQLEPVPLLRERGRVKVALAAAG